MIEFQKEISNTAICTYVHGSGMSVRSLGNPACSGDDYIRALERHGIASKDQLPIVWVFTGVWPKKNKVHTMIVLDHRAALQVLRNPTLILRGERSVLVPLDPDGSAIDSIAEHNLWVQSVLGSVDETCHADYSALVKVSADGVEKYLQDIAEENNQEEN